MTAWFHTQLGFSIVLIIVLFAALLTAAGYCTLFERWISAGVQDRIGPNRAGPRGWLQPLADGIKFLTKEDFIPGHVDRTVFVIAPMLAFAVAVIGVAVIPWGGIYHPPGAAEAIRVQVASLDVGLLYVLAIGAMGVYGVILGSWASNNKYSFYGGMRAAAQMLSYEVPMGLAILVVVLTVGELRLENIVAVQSESWWWIIPRWNVFFHPVAFVVLFVTALAETNRAPFDLAECEQELVGGFHTEYSSMKFALFFLGEYTHMILASAFMTVLFLGGWHVPGLDVVQTSLWGVLLQIGVMIVKIGMFIFLFMMVRWTLPRFRFDQVMRMTWKGLVPLMMVIVGATCLLLYLQLQQTLWATISDFAILLGFAAIVMLTTGQVTGRQPHLLPVPRSPGRVW